MSREIFRSAALAKLSSPDQLDALLYVTTPRHWGALLGMLVLLAAAVAWGFNGRLSTKAEGKGAAVRAGNLMNVATLTGGQVTRLHVKVGDLVQAGQVVATVGQPELIEKLRASRIQLESMREQVNKRVEIRTSTSLLEQESLKRQREALLQRGVAVRQQLLEVESQIPAYQELLRKGLVARQNLTSLVERKAELENTLSTIQSQLVQLDAERFKSQAAVDETRREGERQVADQQVAQRLQGLGRQGLGVRCRRLGRRQLRRRCRILRRFRPRLGQACEQGQRPGCQRARKRLARGRASRYAAISGPGPSRPPGRATPVPRADGFRCGRSHRGKPFLCEKTIADGRGCRPWNKPMRCEPSRQGLNTRAETRYDVVLHGHWNRRSRFPLACNIP